MQLSEFNHASAEAVTALLQQCVHITAWAEAICQQRPFMSKADLMEYAKQYAMQWQWAQIEAALATHPCIGENRQKLL